MWILEAARMAWAFVRRNWQALALTGIVLLAGYGGCRAQSKLDAGKIAKRDATIAGKQAALDACAARVGEYAASEAGYLETIKTLRDNDAEEEREIEASRQRTMAMTERAAAAQATLLAEQAARRDAENRAKIATYQATDAIRALDELMLRLLEWDSYTPPGTADSLRAQGHGERLMISGGS